MSYRDATRAVRLIQIMELLDQRSYTAQELAARFGVSRWTIRRDLQIIEGEPIYYPLCSNKGIYWKLRI